MRCELNKLKYKYILRIYSELSNKYNSRDLMYIISPKDTKALKLKIHDYYRKLDPITYEFQKKHILG